MIRDLIVIGGGASGLMAAITARNNGVRKVTVVESQSEPGKKLLLTGAGKCNFTHSSIHRRWYPSGGDSRVLQALIDEYDGPFMVKTFRDLGLESEIDDHGRVFPVTGKSKSLLSILMMELNRLSIEVIVDSPVTAITPTFTGDQSHTSSFTIHTSSGDYVSQCLLVATGGRSYPSTGSNGSGYDLLSALGHSVTTLHPVMVPLRCTYGHQKMLHGQKWFSEVKLLRKGKILHQCCGDIMFTKKGITGLAVFELTAIAAPCGYENTSVEISLFPAEEGKGGYQDRNAVLSALSTLAEKYPNRTVIDLLTGFLPIRLVKGFSDPAQYGLSLQTTDSKTFFKALQEVIESLSCISLQIHGDSGWSHAQVTSGGVALKEITEDFQSNIVPNLWITGETVDIHGVCGGYNLHFAWASAMKAGKNIARTWTGSL